MNAAIKYIGAILFWAVLALVCAITASVGIKIGNAAWERRPRFKPRTEAASAEAE